MLPTVDSIIHEAVESIWQRYEKNENDELNYEESRKFFKETLFKLGETGDP